MTRVLVTGANGFVGRFVCAALAAQGNQVIAAVRIPSQVSGMATVQAGPGTSLARLTSAVRGADAVIHLAAVVHDMNARITDAEYGLVNCDYPLLLARAAVAAAVPRFVFVSSVKVHGDSTAVGSSLRESSPAAPRDAYAHSKWRAEEGLRAMSASTGLQTCCVRPPLIYGPSVRANFLRLMRWVRHGWPLPFAALHNARSLLYVENLADLLARLAVAPLSDLATTYLVADHEDLSTPALVRAIATSLGVVPRLFALPEALLRRGLATVGRADLAERLLDSLCVDGSLVRRELDWTPPWSVAEGLRRTADWYKGQA